MRYKDKIYFYNNNTGISYYASLPGEVFLFSEASTT